MGKVEISREVTERDVSCLKNVVVGYNTIFLMSSILIISIAASTHDIFSDFYTLLSPSVLLLFIGGFIVLLASVGYIGVARNSSTLINVYTITLVFIFVLEIGAGIGILSFRKEIRSTVTNKVKKAIEAYPEDAVIANTLDFVQLQFRCCGVNSYWDWDGILNAEFMTDCKTSEITLPRSCCRKFENLTAPVVNKRGCLNSISFSLHKSSLLLSTAIMAICTVQILGAYFSYSLGSTLFKWKCQKSRDQNATQNNNYQIPMEYREKANYF